MERFPYNEGGDSAGNFYAPNQTRGTADGGVIYKVHAINSFEKVT